MSAVEIRDRFHELASEVKDANGCLSVKMSDLRDRVQAGRLDEGPLAQIKRNLEMTGLAATRLERQQSEWTMVYTRDSAIGKVIAAASGALEHSAADLKAAIHSVAADQTMPSSEREELDMLRATVEQVKALVSVV